MTRAQAAMLGPIEWGRRDCCTGACDVFLGLWGVDPMQPLRGRYRSAGGAAREVLARGGWVDMCRDLAARAGLVAGRGDAGEIGLSFEGDARGLGGRALLIGLGGGLWAGKNDKGLQVVNRVEHSWRL